ncbi:MAG: phospholipid/glycerol acyltransferase [Betaproteobacteria bacterium]|nr:phospholipid/glycerol acyltransferase [Betaproteobacteria bacterium]
MPALLSATSARLNRFFIFVKFPYECLVLYGGLLLFTVAFSAWSTVAMLIYPLVPRTVRTRFGQTMAMRMFGGYIAVLKASGIFKFDLTALDTLRGDGAMIIAPNHPSLLDAVMIGSRLPRITCIMKAEIQDNFILGGGARLAGYIRDTPPLAMIRSAVASLRAGNQVLMFPEGTRTRQQNRYDFKGGYALIAKTAGVPVQTVFIETNSLFLSKGWPLLKKPAFPLIYRVRLGHRFEVGSKVKAAVAEMESYHHGGLASPTAVRMSPHAPDPRPQRDR